MWVYAHGSAKSERQVWAGMPVMGGCGDVSHLLMAVGQLGSDGHWGAVPWLRYWQSLGSLSPGPQDVPRRGETLQEGRPGPVMAQRGGGGSAFWNA